MPRIACLLAATLATTCLATASHAATPYIYAVNVTTNTGDTFPDCFIFDRRNLTIQGLPGRVLPFTLAPTTPKTTYVAVSVPDESTPYALAFSGTKTGNATTGTLSAVGADDAHVGYKITGTAIAACPPVTDVARAAAKWTHKN